MEIAVNFYMITMVTVIAIEAIIVLNITETVIIIKGDSVVALTMTTETKVEPEIRMVAKRDASAMIQQEVSLDSKRRNQVFTNI